jgi:hypothetical protein
VVVTIKFINIKLFYTYNKRISRPNKI